MIETVLIALLCITGLCLVVAFAGLADIPDTVEDWISKRRSSRKSRKKSWQTRCYNLGRKLRRILK